MATIDANPTKLYADVTVHQWETLTSADTATPIESRAAIASVQFVGTFDGATVVLEGSNDGSNYVTLKDLADTSISFTSAGVAELSTAMAYLRPSTSGGGGSQDIDCFLVARG